ncbi:MAG: hypothetical protein ABH814_00605 [bacterium]
MSKYSVQLTEKIRLDIGRLLIAHEISKLFPKWAQMSGYGEIKVQVNFKWAQLKNETDIRDFWNLVDSLMMGYKLKNITKEVTSQQYSWELINEHPIEQLRFCTDIGGMQSNKKTAREVGARLGANPGKREELYKEREICFPPIDERYLDPIIVLKQNNDCYVHDGNGRLLKAILDNQGVIKAYVGNKEEANPELKFNHWIPTAFLQRLADLGQKASLVRSLQESDNAVIEFEKRVCVEDDQFKRDILTIVKDRDKSQTLKL